MTIRRFEIPVTVDENGDAEVYSPYLSGELVSIHYEKDDFEGEYLAFTLSAEATGETLWAEEDVIASATRYPRAPTTTTAGAAATFDGTYAVLGKIPLGRDRVKIVVAGAGDTTSGTFHITIDG